MIEVKHLMILCTAAVAVCIYGILKFVQFCWDANTLAAKTNVPEDSKRHWLWGHLANWPGPNEAGLAYVREKIKTFPYWRTVWWGPFLSTILTYHPETVKPLLKTAEPKPVLSIAGYRFVKPWLGEGLITSGGVKWARNRRLLTPAFHFEILKPYMQINNECCSMLLSKIAAVSDSDKSMEVFKYVSLCTLDVLLRCAMSYESRCQEEGMEHPYVKAVEELNDGVIARAQNPFLYLDFFYNVTKGGRRFKKNCNFVHEVAEKLILKRKERLEANANDVNQQETEKRRHLDFLDILLSAKDQDGNGLTDKEIRDEVDTFMFAGHDTTASTISWTLYSMAENPESQEKVQQELDDILGDRTKITWDDLPNLKYLTLCIKESLRLHSPVPMVQRLLTQTHHVHGVDLPAGNQFQVSIYGLHHNSKIWEDPMDFRPERMLPENMKDKDPFAFIPFSAGPRNCIGQQFAMHELKVMIGRILQRYSVHLDPDRKTEKKMGAVMKTQDGMYLKFKTRDK